MEKITLNKILQNYRDNNSIFDENDNFIKDSKRKIFRLFEDVGISKEIFRTGQCKTIEFNTFDEETLFKILDYNKLQINRVKNGKYDLIDESALKKDVDFFCAFLSNYLNDNALNEAQNAIKTTLNVENAIKIQKVKFQKILK